MLVVNSCRRRTHLVLPADIAGESLQSPRRVARLSDRLRQRGFAPAEDRNRPTFLSEPDRCCLPDATARPGHHCRLDSHGADCFRTGGKVKGLNG